ncbi:MAG: neutral/alkaline non-lysosomal ceramidase N-terminal domain-containing protein [archaeon]|nr:neutral/alkaline non-lysosomal ceramidase N-terminal domain-containing protein [archaeon]
MLLLLIFGRDLIVPAVQKAIASAAADAMVTAWQNMVPAQVGVSSGLLTNVTHNRRSGVSPYVSSTTIDPHMAVLRVDDQNGSPIATAWNYACHGTCYGPDNLQSSGDILGVANAQIEEQLGGVALFLQADAGDVSPTGEACSGKPVMAGGVTMGNAAMVFRSQATTFASGQLTTSYSRLDLGQGAMDWSLARNENCTSGGPLDICSICEKMNCTASLAGGQSWLEETPRLNSVRLDLGGSSSVFITAPVEAIVEYGWWIRNATADMGFATTFFMGYTNAYDMYLCTPNEWELIPNGYECSLNLWGVDESSVFYNAQYSLLKAVAPPPHLATPNSRQRA